MISAAVLVLELAFIRQVPAEVRAISYFTNLLLMSAFFGLGLGCILQDRLRLRWLLPVGLFLMLGFILVARGLVVYEDASSVHYWIQHGSEAHTAPRLPLFPAALVAFAIGAIPFVALGQSLAESMNRFPRLVAYSWDIGGSLAGTLLFSLASYFSLPPWIWQPLLAAGLAFLLFRSRWGRSLTLLAGFAYLIFAQLAPNAQWSPYYFIQHEEDRSGLRVFVNSSFHQLAIDFASEDPALEELQSSMMKKFSIPYQRYRDLHEGRGPERVLVLGAGTGNDVVVALHNGARKVVAVEIDPVILALGRSYNTSRPYDDARVTTVVDDARHYYKTSDQTFDMVVLGTLDSQTLLSGNVNLRLENYVYTVEAFRDARRLLAEDGLLTAYYSVFGERAPWLYGRLYATVAKAFDGQAQIRRLDSAFLFNTLIMASKQSDVLSAEGSAQVFGTQALPSRDDWPFLYLEKPSIPPVYLKLLGAVLLLVAAAFVLLRRLHPVRKLHANFLFLGIGFTLMESAAIVRLALIFGSTWTVNAVVFATVLLTIFITNWMVMKEKALGLRWAWIGLGASILLNVFFPLPWLFALHPVAKIVACGVLIGLPVHFAAVCFSRLFASQKTTGYALGVNLVGAMAGGTLEYLSMYFGMRGVWLVALTVYGLAMLATGVAKRK